MPRQARQNFHFFGNYWKIIKTFSLLLLIFLPKYLAISKSFRQPYRKLRQTFDVYSQKHRRLWKLPELLP